MRARMAAALLMAGCAFCQVRFAGVRASGVRSKHIVPELLPGVIYGKKNDLTVYSYPPLPTLPAAGGTFVDPTFGTPILRLTDGNDGLRCRHIYSNRTPFNVDNTRIAIQCVDAAGNGPTYIVNFDPVTFQRTGRTTMTAMTPTGKPTSVNGSWSWSATDPDLAFASDSLGTTILTYQPSTDTWTIVKNLAGYMPPGSVLNRFQKAVTNDDIFAVSAFIGENAVRHFLWKRSTDQVLAVYDDCGSVPLDKSVNVSKHGDYWGISCVHGSVPGNPVERIYRVADNTLVREHLIGGLSGQSHGDWGAAIMVGRTENVMNARRYDGGSSQFLNVLSGYEYMGSHTSMRADSDAWGLTGFFDGDGIGGVAAPIEGYFHQEIIAHANDGSYDDVRLVHHRSLYSSVIFQSVPDGPGWAYYCTPRAALSRDGKFFLWDSNWENQGSSDWSNWRLDVFVARLR